MARAVHQTTAMTVCTASATARAHSTIHTANAQPSVTTVSMASAITTAPPSG